ncbi:MAG: VOC family protein [Actinomycetota bacterium]
MAVSYRPQGYNDVTPYLIVENAAEVIDFVTSVLGGKERMRMAGANGGIGHTEVEVGDSLIMMADSAEAENNVTMTAMIHVYLEDVDAAYKAAIGAGLKSEREPVTQFYGDRVASVSDRFGNIWYLATHVEDVPPEEMAKRAAEWQAQQEGQK